MGLGKTIQTAAFLCALFDSNLVSHALLVMPVSVIEHWKEELTVKWYFPPHCSNLHKMYLTQQ